MRALRLAILLAPAAAAPVTLLAQGVPVGDYKKIATELLAIATDRDRTLAERTHTVERERQNRARDEQLAAVEETLRLLSETSRFVPDLEGAGISGGAGSLAGAAQIYALDDNNPYAERIMGDAPVSIEQMISDMAAKHAGHPALSKAGINAVEFRCWFQALVKQESNFSIGARSPKAAFGLTQIIPGTAQYLGIYPAYYDDPKLQLEGGARYLLEQLDRFGSMPLALAAYNAGPGAVSMHGGIPPFAETRDYVVRITGYYNRYAARMGGDAAMMGTLDPRDMVIARASNVADAALGYATWSMDSMHGSMARLQAILMEVENTHSVKTAMDLNTYARAEVARMAAMLTRLKAVARKAEAARYALLWEAYARDEEYLNVRFD